MEDNENKSSKFSSGLNIIMRIDNLWKNCANFKRNGQYNKWNDELDTIWLELARDISENKYYDDKNEKGEIINIGTLSKFKKFDNKLKLHLPIKDSIGGFSKPDKDYYTKRASQYEILMDKQLFLARLENDLGKGTTLEEEDEDF